MTDSKMKCLQAYLESLASNEPFLVGSPTERGYEARRTSQSFADGFLTTRDPIQRCSDDFRYFSFDDTSKQVFLPPLNISFSENEGRFLQASRDIEPGETLFWECPPVLTPKGGAGPVCLNCFLSLDETNWPVCDNCKSPKCKEYCDGGEHSSMECDILSSAFDQKDITSNLNLVKKLNIILTPLRTYISILELPSIENLVQALQSNVDIRKKSAIGEFVNNYIVSFFEEKTKLGLSSEFIHQVCGVFDTNAFDVTLGNKRQARALLPVAALMNHSCMSNTQHSFLGGHCVFRASVPIRKGEQVTNNYTHALWCTKTRLSHLELTKYFICTCPRCKDPSELGSRLNSIKCQKCQGKGLIFPPTPNAKAWICDFCGDATPASASMNIIKVASAVVARAETMDKIALSNMLRKLHTMLGRQHYTAINLNIVYIKKVIADLEAAQETELLEVLSSCDVLMQTADKIEPGLTKLRGLLLLYKLRAATELVRRSGARSSPQLSTEEGWKVTLALIKDRTKELDGAAEEGGNILKWDAMSVDVDEVSKRWESLKEHVEEDVLSENKVEEDMNG